MKGARFISAINGNLALFKEMYKISIPVAYKLKTVLGRYEPEK